MRNKAIFASFMTIGVMSLFIMILLSPVIAAVAANAAEGSMGPVLGLAIGVGLVVAINGLMWLISPWIMDLVNRWAYRCRDITLEELGSWRPAVAQFVYATCQRHQVSVPTLKLIDDMNPTAYCYGSTANRSRLVVTRGLLHYLDDEELKAVYAHELGHIIHRDFIVMTIASTLLSILWQIYVTAKHMKRGNNKGGEVAALVAVVAYVFWWVSQYLLLYLSRVREYYADEFAGAETNNPNALSMALVKVAYGIARQPQSDFSKKLMGGTRALGISDPKGAQSTGQAYAAANGGGHQMAQALSGYQVEDVKPSAEGISRIEKVFLFDLFNPWAKVLELGSTHPLTGKRIRVLCGQAAAMNQRPLFSFEPIDAYGKQLDFVRLNGNFAFEVAVWFAPEIFATGAIVLGLGGLILGSGAVAGIGFGGVVLAIGLGMTFRGFYKFPTLGQPQAISVMELMMDPYASPLRGRPVMVQGVVIGRADAGSEFAEDMMMEDPQGGLIALNYEHWLPLFGNMWFGYKTVSALVGQQFQATGWFRRGVGQQVDLAEMRMASGEQVESYTGFWGRAGGVAVALIGLIVAVGAAAASMSATTV